MANSRPEKVVNILSAFLVLVAGFYVILFLPISISPLARIIIGVLLVGYFLVRLRLYRKKYGRGENDDRRLLKG